MSKNIVAKPEDLYLKAEIKLYYDLHIPADLNAPSPLIIAVHGYGAHKRYMMREARSVTPDNFVIASIQAPYQHFRKSVNGYRVGFGWLTDFEPEQSIELHHKFINDLIDNLAKDGTVDKDRIYLYGFSQACALNFRYAMTFPEVLKGLIAVCGSIPGDIDTNPLFDSFTAETLYLYGDDDEFYSIEKFHQNDAKLRSLLPNYNSKQYNAAHIITDEMREEITSFLTRF